MASSFPTGASQQHPAPIDARTLHLSSDEQRTGTSKKRVKVVVNPMSPLNDHALLPASVLPSGFPPELAFRALAAYALLRTLSSKLRLSPFTPNVFLRALCLPCPNRLLGQIHVCLLSMLFPNLDLGYSYRPFGGQFASKRRRIEDHHGVRHITVPVVAGDNLTYLDGLSWPLFFDDYVRLTEDTLWSAMSGGLTVDFRKLALRSGGSEVFEDSEEEEDTEEEKQSVLAEQSSSRMESNEDAKALGEVTVKKVISPRERVARGKGLPTRKNRTQNLGQTMQQDMSKRGTVADSGSDYSSGQDNEESDYEDESTSRKTSYTLKRKRKSQETEKSQPMKARISNDVLHSKSISPSSAARSSPGSRVIEVSVAERPSPVFPLPIPLDSSKFRQNLDYGGAAQSTYHHSVPLHHGANWVLPWHAVPNSFATPPSMNVQAMVDPVQVSMGGASQQFVTNGNLTINRAFGEGLQRGTKKNSLLNVGRVQHTDQTRTRQKQPQKQPKSLAVSLGIAREIKDFALRAVKPSALGSAVNPSDQVPQSSSPGEQTAQPATAIVTGRPDPDGISHQISRSHDSPVETQHAGRDAKVPSSGGRHTLEAGADADAKDTETTESCDQLDSRDAWPHFKAVELMRNGLPYHQLTVGHKLDILEFLIDELLTVDFIAAEFSRRDVVTGCFEVPYGMLPSASELQTLENDDECLVCGMEGELLCCDGCTASYHRRCINMAIGTEIPEGTWLCAECMVLDPALFGPLRGGRKSALDWFTLKDIEEAPPQRVAGSDATPSLMSKSASSGAPVTQPFESTGIHTSATESLNPLKKFPLKGDTDSLIRLSCIPADSSLARPETEESVPNVGLGGSQLQQVSSRAQEIIPVGNTDAKKADAEAKPSYDEDERNKVLDQTLRSATLRELELLVIHGFVFCRRRTNGERPREGQHQYKQYASGQFALSGVRKKWSMPLNPTELRKFLSTADNHFSRSWPLAQIPNHFLAAVPRHPRQVNKDQFFASPETHNPFVYLSRYRLAPHPRAKKQKCVGSQMQNLVQSEYEIACVANDTHGVSSRLSRDMSSDRSLVKQLRAGSDLYNPYHLFTAYMLKLERTLKMACLIHERWGTRNSRGRSDIWSKNVTKCRSVNRLALLLVKLVDATNIRAFIRDWYRSPSHICGKSETGLDANRTYMPLPSDWTSELEIARRNLERSSLSHLRGLLVDGAAGHDVRLVIGGKINSRSSGGGKRKHSKPPVRTASVDPTQIKKQRLTSTGKPSKATQLQLGSFDRSMVSSSGHVPSSVVLSTSYMGLQVPAGNPSSPFNAKGNGDRSSNSTSNNVQGAFTSVGGGSVEATPGVVADSLSQLHGIIEKQNGEKMKLDGEQADRPKRSRRSGRLRSRASGVVSSGKGSSSSLPGPHDGFVSGNAGMKSLISLQRESKLRMLEELMSVPFEKELNWPLAGRALFEPVGCLPPCEMKRLARKAGAVVAPFLTYSSSFEVGQPSVCHIWRKKTLRCNSFEKLLMQIRVLESYLDRPVIGACESLARRAATNKALGQKVVRCTQRDLATGATHYFVVNKGKLRGCWIPEETVDLSTLIQERSNRRNFYVKKFRDQLKPSVKAPGAPLTQRGANVARIAVPDTKSERLYRAVAKPPVGVNRRAIYSKTENKHTKPGLKAVVETILLQHQRETGVVLVQCAGLCLSSVPQSTMNDIRGKHMMQLRKAVKQNGVPPMSESELTRLLTQAEAAARLQYQSNQSMLTVQNGNPILSIAGVNGGYLPTSAREGMGGLTFNGGHSLNVAHNTVPPVNPSQSFHIDQSQPRAQFGEASVVQPLTPQVQISLARENAKVGQNVYVNSLKGPSGGPVLSSMSVQGLIPTSAASQQNPAYLPMNVQGMPGLQASFLRGSAHPQVSHCDHLLNQSVARASNSQHIVSSQQQLNWFAPTNGLANPSGVQPQSWNNSASVNPTYIGSQQQLVGSALQTHMGAPSPYPGVVNPSLRNESLCTMDFEPRPLEEMTEDAYS